MESSGFWSYVHNDNRDEGGRITELAQHVSAAFGLLTGEELELFVDRDLVWGAAWEKRISEALVGTTFFIPVVTPRYFKSEACREELLAFWGEAQRSGLDELLLPIYYVDVPELESGATDEVMAVVASRQWVDFRQVRFEEFSSAAYRKTVAQLARRLAEIGEAVSDIPDAPSAPGGSDDGEDDGPPGILEELAAAEAAVPASVELLGVIGTEMERLGDAAEAAADAVHASDRQGRGFAGRLATAQRYAEAAVEPARNIRASGELYASKMIEADPGTLTIIETVEAELEAAKQLQAELREPLVEFLDGLQDNWQASQKADASAQAFVESFRENAKLSRNLRKPLADVEAGVRGVADGNRILKRWAERAKPVRKLVDSLPDGVQGGP